MPNVQTKLSFLEKLNYGRIVAQAAIFALAKLVAAYLLPNKEYKGLGIARCVYPSVMKYVFSRVPMRTLRGTMPSTRKSIEKYCSKQKLQLHSEDLFHGAVLHWLGPRTSSKVLLFFHGGGYNFSISDGHIRFSLKMASAANASLALLEYTLAPPASYPSQLREAAAALAHLLTTYPASNIIIAGDSAGGHLAAGLLSHLIHPSENIEHLKLEGKLGGICFISPFTGFDYSKASYKENEKHDYLTLESIQRFNSTFKPVEISNSDAIKDPLLSPEHAPPGWWDNAPVERLIVLWGTWEIFADGCLAFGKRLQSEAGKTSNVKVFESPREFHDGAIIDANIGLDERDTAKTILSWMEQFK